jgi:hypothetical protein
MQRLLGLIFITALFLITAACSGGGGGASSTSTSANPAAVEKPTVSSTVPAQNQANVAPNTVVSVVFSNPMQQDGVDYDGFTVSDGTSIVPGTVSCLGNSAIFRPVTPFAKNTTYTVKVTKNVKDINGNGMAEDQTWSFTTGTVADITPPHVTASNPYWNSVGVSANSSVLITFSEPVDPATVNATTLTVTGPSGPVAGTITTTGINATFLPNLKFDYLTPYTITVTQGVKDFAGNPLNATTVIKFSTSDVPDIIPPQVSSVTPVSGAVGVSASTPLTVTFSEAVIPTTVSFSTFVVSELGGKVTGSVSAVDKVATFTPSAALKPSTVYTAIVKTGIKDLSGNPLSGNYTWSFTTAASSQITDSNLFADYVAIPTGTRPEAVAIGDVNGDGRADVVMVTSDNDYKLCIYLQNADGTLAAPVKIDTGGDFTHPPSSVAIGDVNGDGKVEVVVGNSGSKIVVFRLDAAGGLVAKTEYASAESDKIKIADLNNDGRMDVVGIGVGTGKANVWYQKAATDLADPLNAPVSIDVPHAGIDDLDVGDVNGDGLTDIVVMSGQGFGPNIQVVTQKTGGGFNAPVSYSVGSGVLTAGVAVGDVNGDGKQDVVVTTAFTSNVGVFLQNGSGTLDPVVNYSAKTNTETVEIADVSGDGRKDVIVLNGGGASLGIFQQAVDGTLKAEELCRFPDASHYNRHGLAIGDINSDGKPDIVFTNTNLGLVILYHK